MRCSRSNRNEGGQARDFRWTIEIVLESGKQASFCEQKEAKKLFYAGL
jgi:hypothetical protein